MPVDEFGREIQHHAQNHSHGGGASGHSSSSYHHSHSPHHHHQHHHHHNTSSSSSSHHNSSYHQHHHHHHHSQHGNGGQHSPPPPWKRSPSPSTTSSSQQRSHRKRGNVVFKYVQDPMMCEFLWKDQRKSNNNNNANPEDHDPNASAANENDETYDDYRQRYCLNYIRSFFNEHMDDSWFRNQYSPLYQVHLVKEERERARTEAEAMFRQIQTTLFLPKARLGGGIKQTTPVVHNSNNKRPLSATGIVDSINNADTSSSVNMLVPKTHLHAMHYLFIEDIPPFVTEDQIRQALHKHFMSASNNNNNNNTSGQQQQQQPPPQQPPTITIFSGHINSSDTPLYRDALCVLPSADAKQDLLNNLLKATVESMGHVPRKDDRKVIEVDVECTDPYGRVELEGNTNNTESVENPDKTNDNANNNNNTNNENSNNANSNNSTKIAPRKDVVRIRTTDRQPPVTVLSAALSSQTRISKDKDAAILMARALDVEKKIPNQFGLDAILESFFPQQQNQDSANASEESDVLDIAIAYLRRVHLFSFYGGCTRADNLVDAVQQPIHLRLKNADDILLAAARGGDQQGINNNNESDNKVDAGEENNNNQENDAREESKSLSVTTDLLVKRLDEAISKALQDTSHWIAQTNVFVNSEVDGRALEIQALEKQTESEWMAEHGIVDNDGRARCAFSFCRKLFKGEAFLKKHLLKKHSDQLRAEKAKCHDGYMMEAWDNQEVRPVPPILVDCGSNFGNVPSPVLGSQQPMAEDPEPRLWKQEEERRRRIEQEQEQRRLLQQRRFEQQQQQREQQKQYDHQGESGSRRGKNFVDVDDMKEEKVELNFDAIVVPVEPPKKKKKKKKKLL